MKTSRLVLLILLFLASCARAQTPVPIVSRDEIAYVAPRPFLGGSSVITLGGKGQVLYIIPDQFTGVTWVFHGRSRECRGGLVELLFDWEEVSWPSTGRDGEGSSEEGRLVEEVPGPDAAFPLDPPRRVLLRRSGEEFTVAAPTNWFEDPLGRQIP